MNSLTAADLAALQASVDRSLRDGQRPDEDDRFRAVGDDAEVTFIRTLAEEAATKLDGKPADRILAWAAGVVPRFVITSSFGAESAVMLHLVSRVAPEVPVLFLETGFHFDETLAYRRRLARALDLTVIDVRPEISVTQQAERFGPELYALDPDACCGLRKTLPLRKMLANFDGWATGVRRAQTPERARTPVVEARRHEDRWLVKVAPLATWTDSDVAAYLDEHDLPRHPLAGEGFRSIGCAPCTHAVAPDADPRAGRWSRSGKTECGIHLPDDDDHVRTTTTPG